VLFRSVDEAELKNVEATQKKLAGECKLNPDDVLTISAKIESELAELSTEEVDAYLKDLGLAEPGLNRLIKKAYHTLDLLTFFTSGEMETKAWTVRKGAMAPEAAGVIHSDFEKAFIRAEIMDWKDLITHGEAGCRDKGLLRIEGKEYVMRDGDVVHFRVGV
jgi:ribosome-binding ATPase YchF (GTP1/OBG family)